MAEGKKAKRAARREELLSSLLDSGDISRAEASKLADRVGVMLASSEVEVQKANESPQTWRRSERMLDDLERQQVLQYLSIGMNVSAAVKSANIDYYRYNLTYRNDPEFKQRVILERKATVGMCTSELYTRALSGDLSCAQAFIRYAQTNDTANFNRSMQREEFQLRKKVIDRSLGDIEKEARPSLHLIPKESYEDFCTLDDRFNDGESLESDEMIRWASYQQLIIKGTKEIQANQTKGMLEHVMNLPSITGKNKDD